MAESANAIQSSEQAPAQPAYVLRGHAAQIHALNLLTDRLRLLSGDAEGWVVLWSLATKRALAVWRAHGNAILGLGSWDEDKIITHGRDNKLYIWQFRPGEERKNYSTLLPISDSSKDRPQPWLLHSLDVNALNFCAFAQCADFLPEAQAEQGGDASSGRGILIATPGVQDGQINITSLPSEERITTIPSPKDTQTGMTMALALHFLDAGKGALTVIGGYESGHACVWKQTSPSSRHWQLTYTHQAHAQPVLSLAVASGLGCFYTSSADAIVARHKFCDTGAITKVVQTRHAGQQALRVRNDERIFATAGWDGKVRVYSARAMKELAVLKWHNEGCYALALADVDDASQASHGDGKPVAKRDQTVSEQRTQTAKATHWLAAGSKDGKVSLWDIY